MMSRMPNRLGSTGGNAGIMDRMKSIPWTYVAIAVVIIVSIIALYFIFSKQIAAMVNPKYKANSEHIPVEGLNNGKDVELLFFSTDWCPHCKTAKPEWEQLESEYKDKTINGRRIIFTDVNCTNESPDVAKMMDQYKIEGFPTIKLLKDGQVISYDAKPTKATLVQFLNTAV